LTPQWFLGRCAPVQRAGRRRTAADKRIPAPGTITQANGMPLSSFDSLCCVIDARTACFGGLGALAVRHGRPGRGLAADAFAAQHPLSLPASPRTPQCGHHGPPGQSLASTKAKAAASLWKCGAACSLPPKLDAGVGLVKCNPADAACGPLTFTCPQSSDVPAAWHKDRRRDPVGTILWSGRARNHEDGT
jgi:hypothetical protein